MPRAPAVILAAGLLAALVPGPVQAHPHVWVSTETTVLFEGGSIVGFRHKWTFDEFYSAMAIQGLDTNNDGKLDRTELAELAKVNIAGLKEFAYFTHPKLSGEALKLGEATDYWLEHVEAPSTEEPPPADAASAAKSDTASSPEAPPSGVMGRLKSWFGGGEQPAAAAKAPPPPPKVLSLNFTVPLAQPVLPEAKGFTFLVSDPGFFIAFEISGAEAIKLGKGAPATCRVAVAEPERTADDAKRLDEAFATQLGPSLGAGFAKTISLTCEPQS